MMLRLAPGVRIYLAAGRTDMRKGINGLSVLVQDALQKDPFSGHLFVFRGRKGNLVKILTWDGQGFCLFVKRLERGYFVWPSPDCDVVKLGYAQLSMLLEGIDWRTPQKTWRPERSG